MTPYPMAMQMRYLQALSSVASDQNSTIIFPLPIELLAPFLKHGGDGASSAAQTNGKVEAALLGAALAAGPGATPAPVALNGR
jgi:hypothetical protein